MVVTLTDILVRITHNIPVNAITKKILIIIMKEFKLRKQEALKTPGMYCKVYLSKSIHNKKETHFFGKITGLKIDDDKESIIYLLDPIKEVPNGEKIKRYLEKKQVELSGDLKIHTRTIKTLSRPIDIEVLQRGRGLSINGNPLI